MVNQVSESHGGVGCGLVGYYVGKDCSFGIRSDILGKVASYNGDTKLYTVVYENGDNEDLDHRELRDILMVDDGGSGMKLSCRKRKLDQLVPSPLAYKGPNTRSKKNPTEVVPIGAPKAPPLGSQLGLDSSDDADSTVDSINYDSSSLQESVKPPLPPSSGDLSVPEDSVPNLFSVYNFLRSFSLQLFLSPFGLDDFVGALNCATQNSLMDAVHVSLMQALRRHLEMLSSEGSVLASQCLRRHDWTLLDTLTWSTLLVEYLYIMGFMKGLQNEGFSADDLQREYYRLHAATKLKVLQILCDAIIDSAELRAVLEMRDDMEEEKEYNVDASGPPENGPRRVHPRHSKTSAWKNMQALESSDENKKLIPISTDMELGTDATDASPDENTDECVLCGMDGTLICCDGCPSAYHSRCIGLNKASLPAGLWHCPECVVNKLGPTSLRIGRGTSGAEVFGVDIYGRLFVGTCNYLLVTETSPDANSASRYYNQDDVVKVLGVICATGELLSAYKDICKGISKYWEIPPIMQNGKAENVGNSHGYVTSSFASDTNKLFCKDNKEILCPKEDGSGTRVKDSDLDKVDIQDSQKYASECHDNKMKTTEAIDGASIRPNNGCPTRDASRIDQKTLPFVSISTSSESQSWSLTEKHIRDKSWIDLTLFKSHAYSNQYVLGDVAASAAANLAVLASEERRVPEAQASSNPRKILAANTALQVKAFSRAAINFLWPSHERKQMEAPRERCGWCIACKGSSVNKRGCLLNLAASSAIKRFTRSMSVPSIKQDRSHLLAIATHITNMEESLRGLIVGPFVDANFVQQWRNQIRQASFKDLKSALLELEKKIRAIAFSRDWIKMVDDWPSLESSAAQTGNGTGPNQKHGSIGRRSKRQSVTSEFAEAYKESRDYVQWWRGASLSKLLFQKGVLPSSLVKKAARQGGRRWITGVSYTECPEFPRRNRQFAWRAAVEMSKNASQLALQVRYLDAHLRWRDLVRPDQNPLEGKGSDVDATIFRNACLCDKKLSENRILYAINFANQKHLPLRVLKNVLDSERIEDGSDKLWFSEKHVPLFLIKEFEEKAAAKSGLCCLTKSKGRHPKYYSRDIFSYLLIKLEKPSKFSCTSCQVDVLLRNAVRCNTCQGFCHEDCVVSSTIHKDGDIKFLFTCNPCHPAKCASCHVDVLLRDAVKCSTCQGNCHKGCMVSLTVNKDGNLESMFMCNPCYLAKTAMVAKSHQEVLNHRLSSSEQGQQPIGINCVLRLRSQNSQEKGIALDSCTERKARNRGGLSRTYGLIWKKNKKDERDFDRNFLVDNIIFKGKEGMESSIKPTCRLCHSEYRSDLMYVRCQTCQYWFHADALNLQESQVFELLGFKCCKCRKIASPKCPYLELGHKELDLGYLIQRNAGRSEIATSELARPKRRQSRGKDLVMLDDGLSFGIEQLAYSSIEVYESKPEDSGVVIDDPLLQSLGRVESIDRRLAIEAPPNEPELAVRSQQKLSVRRPQTRRSDGNEFPQGNAQLEQDNSDTYGYEKEGLDPDRGNIEGVEYEPQTYFSFTDLLSSEDEKLDNGFEFSLDTLTNVSDDMKPAVACGKCNLELPSADLMCEICGLCIHSRCSPWVENNEEPGGATKWRCGECREWR